MPSLQIKTQMAVVEDSGVQIPFPEVVTQNEFKKGAVVETELIDNSLADTMTTPIDISLAPYPNTTCIIIRAEYAENDFANGIKAGDRAKFQFKFDSGNWFETYSVTLEGYKPTDPLLQIRAQGSAKILVKRTISAT